MHNQRQIAFFILLILATAAQLAAQTTAAKDTQSADSSPTELKVLLDAGKLRDDAASSISTGRETPDAVIKRLQTLDSPTGMKIDHDADLAFAVIGVGQRLIVSGKTVEAEKLFLEAEKRLVLAVKKTPDKAAQTKAQFLSRLSFIRAQYLGELVQAQTDLDQAMLLQPNDKNLQQMKAMLLSEHAEQFKN